MPQSRHITHSGRPASDRHDIVDAQHDIEDELATSVELIHRHQTTKHGVYVGAPGLLLMDWTIMDVVRNLRDSHGDAIIAPKVNLYSWFPFQKPTSGSRTAFLETDVGAAALILISDLRDGHLDVKGGTDRSRASAILLREAVQVAVDGDDAKDDDGCEVLYGRAGLLYTLLFLRAETHARRRETAEQEIPPDAFVTIVEQLCHDQNIAALVDEIVTRGRRGARQYAMEARSRDRSVGRAPPLMWSWHGKRYLGSAHGVAGILQMLVSVPSHILKQHWEPIIHTVQWLVDVQDSSTGNWTHKASRDLLEPSSHATVTDDHAMVQWCHGASGILILFSALLSRRQHVGATLEIPESLDSAMRSSLALGAKLIYERGLLRKGVGLCHGVAGSVYALLAASDVLDKPPSHSNQPVQDSKRVRATRSRSQQYRDQHLPDGHRSELTERQWLLRAFHLAHLATSYRKFTLRGEMRSPDRQASLFEGLAGMCCAWAEILRRMEDIMVQGNSDGIFDAEGVEWRRRRGVPGYDDLPLW
ncbi:hypothetical protein BDW22DRAFT_1336628 [Trametopsis cervina]|nr:hypothetical protein BDW22DRAFT_1336628 [Trametopsis cervina]